MNKAFAVCFAITCSLAFASRGDADESFRVPELTGPVVDQAQMFGSSEAARLSQLLRGVADHGHAQIQVLTISTLAGESLESASIQVTDKWKLGQAHKDNGVLIFIVQQDRKIRIEVGQGLEGDLPDVYAKRIIEDTMKPLFRNGNYEAGTEAAILQILSYVDSEYLQQLQANGGYTVESRGHHLPSWSIIIIFLMIFLGPILQFFLVRRFGLLGFLFGGWGGGGYGGGGGGNWGGGGGWGGDGGGSWGGGGGGFSGGGASGGW
jgi:uncharacterized protein